MASRRRDPTEEGLDAIAALRRLPDAASRGSELGAFLRHRSNLVIARAAALIAELRLTALVPDLIATFDRLMQNPGRLDKGCAALTGIATALHTLDFTDPEPWLKGIRHVQMEPSYGGPVDNAVRLRAISALGLIRTGHPDAPFEVVNLLADGESGARAGAARAIACLPGDTGPLLLRLKVLLGDRDVEVMAECFAGIAAAGDERSLSFVGSYVDDERPAISDAAILSLGASRSTLAIKILKEKWQRTAADSTRRTLLLALATARHEEAVGFLIEIIRDARVELASEALTVMRIYRGDERVRSSVEAAVRARGSDELLAVFAKEFG